MGEPSTLRSDEEEVAAAFAAECSVAAESLQRRCASPALAKEMRSYMVSFSSKFYDSDFAVTGLSLCEAELLKKKRPLPFR